MIYHHNQLDMLETMHHSKSLYQWTPVAPHLGSSMSGIPGTNI